MNQICIHIPPPQPSETIELDVTAGGRRRLMQYRVESVEFAAASKSERIEQLRAFIRDYDARWELVQIGSLRGTLVPVTFRQRQSVPS